jgi:hypothetical protein
MKKIIILLFGLLTFSAASTIRADVTAVTIQGCSGAYTFKVTLKSTETGCDQYADWWEVVSEKGELLYRRILVHSHPDTQPFTRSGGKIDIKSSDIVYVRAHMNKEGYVGDVLKGSVNTGFQRVTNLPHFQKVLEKQEPLPTGCLF